MANPISFASATNTFAFPLLFSGQAQKEFFVNQSLVSIDALLQRAVVGSIPSPPMEASDGDCYRITAGATDEWTAQEDKIALRVGGAWQFIEAPEGWTVFDRSAGVFLHYNTQWQSAEEPSIPAGGTTIDVEVRAALADLIQTLRNLGIFANPA